MSLIPATPEPPRKKWKSFKSTDQVKNAQGLGHGEIHTILSHLSDCVTILERYLGLPSEPEDSMEDHDTDDLEGGSGHY